MALIFIGSLYSILGIFGIVGNLIFIFLLASNKKTFSNITYTYVIQLAIADCVVLAGIGLHQGLVFAFDIQECDTVRSFFGGLITGGWFTGDFLLVYISISRYLSVVKSHLVPKFFSINLIRISIILAWLPCFLITLSFTIYPQAGTHENASAVADSLNYWS